MLADPNRPKSDKTSILIDTIQTLKDLMTQVDRLKAEHVTLSQESREVLMTDCFNFSNALIIVSFYLVSSSSNCFESS